MQRTQVYDPWKKRKQAGAIFLVLFFLMALVIAGLVMLHNVEPPKYQCTEYYNKARDRVEDDPQGSVAYSELYLACRDGEKK